MIDPLQGVIPFPGNQPGQQQGSFHPGYVAGRIYHGSYEGGLSTLVVAANVAHFHPIYVAHNHVFTGLAIEVQTIGTANNARLGLYSSLNGLPFSAISGTGGATVIPGVNPLQTTGMKITNPLTIPLVAGLYFGVFTVDGSATIEGTTVGQAGYSAMMGTSTLFSAPDGELSATQAFASGFPVTPFTGSMGPPVYSVGAAAFVGLVG